MITEEYKKKLKEYISDKISLIEDSEIPTIIPAPIDFIEFINEQPLKCVDIQYGVMVIKENGYDIDNLTNEMISKTEDILKSLGKNYVERVKL